MSMTSLVFAFWGTTPHKSSDDFLKVMVLIPRAFLPTDITGELPEESNCPSVGVLFSPSGWMTWLHGSVAKVLFGNKVQSVPQCII